MESKDGTSGAAGTHPHVPPLFFNCARNNKTTSIFNGTATRVQIQSWNNGGKTPSRLRRLESSDTAVTRRRSLPAVA